MTTKTKRIILTGLCLGLLFLAGVFLGLAVSLDDSDQSQTFAIAAMVTGLVTALVAALTAAVSRRN